jgi:transposase
MPHVLGIDEWTFKKGHTYGTLLADLEKGKIIDLLADRRTETLAIWLQQHPGIEVMARDRANAYAEAVTAGDSEAI